MIFHINKSDIQEDCEGLGFKMDQGWIVKWLAIKEGAKG